MVYSKRIISVTLTVETINDPDSKGAYRNHTTTVLTDTDNHATAVVTAVEHWHSSGYGTIVGITTKSVELLEVVKL